MLASTGRSGADTPTGLFVILPEWGLHFYNPVSKEGANYWVSFKNYGEFLFHSVPMDVNGHYVVNEAEQLGQIPNSHGCIRLTVADAKWFYENVRPNTPVEVA
ncbi:L,D-transpeptidase [Lactiplantibacillus garii]|uniref:L,D-transpeptidase n=1 Tax=Lactiplantibacillus garii TaxID=2306423 RepID=A0A3R8J8M5_9LACO|nr:L,D-transpeptidase [Lactiplantibacillus garii]RRK10869.1 L,D-transpeptidase [Lactiplantibacillus garii]